MAKKSHLTKSKLKNETSGPLVLEEYFCLKEMQPRPVTMSFLDALAEKLIEFADMDDSLSINKFYRIVKISKSEMQRWRERSRNLNLAYQYALAALGERREEGAITKKFDTGAVWRRLYQFGDEYKEAMEYAAKLAKKEDVDEGGTKIVVVEKMVTDPSMEKYFKGNKDE